ncbi:hypothetical protein TrCOL_g5307 [Triparma columacea]|uniref:Rieske domain-containing protein n=1 Tax=Triparma columacea TaxID=722753 RepID=A0A9W7GJY2_9STRA|nr:hypothetical protein TrCOL_g5307 [Triparma columacea]
MKRFSVIVCLFLTLLRTTSSFIYTKNIKCRHLTLNGTRRRQQRITEVAEGGNKSTPNGGRGVEVTGVTLPNEDKPLKGWQITVPNSSADTLTVVYANRSYFGLSAACPRCAFDLYRGTLNSSCDPATVTCPTCATPYNVLNGQPLDAVKKGGIAGLARTATQGNAGAKAEVYAITVDKQGKVFLRER